MLRQVRASGIDVTAVAADAEFGDCTAVRRMLARHRGAVCLGVSSHLTVFAGTPRTEAPAPRTGPVARVAAAPGAGRHADQHPRSGGADPARHWRTVSWRNGTNAPWRARFWARRVTPAHDWRTRRVAPEVWLLCQRDLGTTPETKAYFVHLPATASLKAVVRLAHHRWAIEQQYAELKDELGLDHFEGRSFHGWHRHVVLTAIAYAFMQRERQRHGDAPD